MSFGPHQRENSPNLGPTLRAMVLTLDTFGSVAGGAAVVRRRADPSAQSVGLVREAGSSFRVHWRLRRLSGCARHRLPSCYSSTAWTVCTPVLGPKSNRVREQKTASSGFLQGLCPSEEALQKPGKDFRHAVLGGRRVRERRAGS